MSICNLKMFPENRVKSLFGLSSDILAQVIVKVLPVLEEKREQRLRNSTERKRRFVARDGRPREVLPIHQLLSADSRGECFCRCHFCFKRFVSRRPLGSGQTASPREMESRRG